VPVPESEKKQLIVEKEEKKEPEKQPVLKAPVIPADTFPEQRPEISEVDNSGNSNGNVQTDETDVQQDTLPESSVSSSQPVPGQPLFHVVQKGETLYGISKQYNVPIDSLMVLNGIAPDAGIQIGQQLFLRQPPSDIETTVKKIDNSSEPYTMYEVLKGDTMYSIARKFNVSVEELQNWNDKTGFDLKIGEFLKIFKR